MVAKTKAYPKLKVQVGVQGMSDDSYETAYKYVKDGALGHVVLAQIDYSRNHKGDFFEYKIDEDAKPGPDLDWNAFLGPARKRPWNPDRFFSWRRYWDYSSGISSDLFIHRVTRIIKSLGLTFPERAVATGGKYQFGDSTAEIPDTMTALIEYPGGLTVQLISSMANDTRVPHLLRGHKATLEFTQTGFTITPQGLYKDEVKPVTHQKSGAESVPLHHRNLMAAIRKDEPLKCDVMLGYYGVVASEMATLSMRQHKYMAYGTRTVSASCMRKARILVLGLLAVTGAAAQYDILLRGGRLIDPRNNIDARRDIAIQNGKIAEVAESIAPSRATQVIDVTGLIVTPGLVDIHTHLFHTTGIAGAWAGDNSIPPDVLSFRTGVTTMVDAGSSGYRNFETFRHTVIDRVSTRVFAMINIAALGMISDATEQLPAEMQVAETARMVRKHRDVVVGIKTAHYQGPEWISVDRAVEAGTLAGVPVMVDFGYFRRERPFPELVLKHLRPGDIATHMFRGPVPWVDEQGHLYPYLKQARERGVRFDVGHGGGSFVMRNAAPAIAQGFYPDSISTDLHTGSMNAGMMDMPSLMSKLMALGMSLPDVILRSTWAPAQIISHPELGHLSTGAAADIAVWTLASGEFGFRDEAGGRVMGRQRLQCEITFRDGRIAWDYNARSGKDWKTLPADYGVRKGLEEIVRPPR